MPALRCAAPAVALASRTHPGCVREANEDHCALFATEAHAGLLVADGVSGQSGGEIASRMAVEITQREFERQDPSAPPQKRLYRAVQRANIEVYDLAQVVPELRGMASTLTAVLMAEDELFAAHVGDCRLYLFRDKRLLQLTRDHTVSAERLRLGLLSKAAARGHPGRAMLTRALGRNLIARADQLRRRTQPQDLVLLCSDGVHGVLEDDEIASLCRFPSPEEVCERLLESAAERGAPDNMTAAAARVTRPVPAEPKGKSLLQALTRPWRR